MNEIIKNIEAEKLKASVQEFHVGDNVKVYTTRSKRVTVRESRFSRVLLLRDRTVAQERLSL